MKKHQDMITISKIIVDDEAISAVENVLKSGMLSHGPVVEELEREFCHLCGTTEAIAIVNGTAALHTALYAAGVCPGDEVITTPFSFVATANAILMAGATPVFADIDPKTYNLNPQEIENKISAKTKAIIVVNLYGQPADYVAINKIAKKHHLVVIEDAAQSVDSSAFGKKSGNLADIACFSLYATKNIFSGEGGMITTNNKEYARRSRTFRNHGRGDSLYMYDALGYNYRMTSVLAAIALAQLKKISIFTKKRQKNAQRLTQGLHDIPEIETPHVVEGNIHVFHQYTIRLKKARQSLMDHLLSSHIQSMVYYPFPLHKIPHIPNKKKLHFLQAERAAEEVLSLPVHPYLTDSEIDRIINCVHDLY